MTPHRRARPYVWTLGLLWGLPAASTALAWLVLPKDPPPGQCEGIGFGCTLSAADSVLLLAVMAAPLLVTAGLVVVAGVAFRRALRARPAQPGVRTGRVAQ